MNVLEFIDSITFLYMNVLNCIDSGYISEYECAILY